MAWAGVATNIKSSCSPFIFTGHLWTQDNLGTALSLWGWLPRQWGQRGRSAQGPCDDGHQGHSPHCAGAALPHLAPPQTERTTATRFLGPGKPTTKPLTVDAKLWGGASESPPPSSPRAPESVSGSPQTQMAQLLQSAHMLHGNSCNVPSLLTKDGPARAPCS